MAPVTVALVRRSLGTNQLGKGRGKGEGERGAVSSSGSDKRALSLPAFRQFVTRAKLDAAVE